MRILVTGASGMLGRYLLKKFDARHEIYAGFNQHRTIVQAPNILPVKLNLNDEDSMYQVAELEPEVIIHAAGITDVDYCEKNPNEATRVNVWGTRNIAKAAKQCGAKLIYISSNDVFSNCNNINRGWTVYDFAEPVNMYGVTKAAAEALLSDVQWLDYTIVRTSFHGWCKNPEHSLSHKIINKLRAGQEIAMATDQFSNLMYAGDLAYFIVKLCKDKFAYKIIHLASQRATSRFIFAHMIAQIFELNPKLIIPVTYEEIRKQNQLVAERPMKAILDTDIDMPFLEDGIYQMKEDEREYFAT